MNHLLSLIIFTPLLAAAIVTVLTVIPMEKEQRNQIARIVALVASAACCVFGCFLWMAYDGSAAGKIQYIERMTWIPSLGIEYYVGVDGISVSMIILSTLVSLVATLAS